jgi:lipopolysaccharide export LptBFGC system permease protein LptF
MTALLLYGPISLFLGRMAVWDGTLLALLLLPSALAVTVPCSVLWVGLVGWQRRSAAGQPAPAASLARSVFLYAIVAATVSFVILVWAVPAANQSFREREWRIMRERNGIAGRTAPPTLTKGLPEMTYAELGRALAASAGTQQQRARLGYSRHLKLAIPAGALAFGLITIALGGSRRTRRWPFLKAATMFGALAFAYYLVRVGGWQLAYALVIPAWLGAWGPPLLFAGSAILLGSIRLRRLALQPTA